MVDFNYVDWLKASVGERQILYRHFKTAADKRNRSADELCIDVTGIKQGLDYDKTLRAGKYSRKIAYQIFDWLTVNEPTIAHAAVEAIYFDRRETFRSDWSRLIARHASTSGLNIVPFELGIVGHLVAKARAAGAEPVESEKRPGTGPAEEAASE